MCSYKFNYTSGLQFRLWQHSTPDRTLTLKYSVNADGHVVREAEGIYQGYSRGFISSAREGTFGFAAEYVPNL